MLSLFLVQQSESATCLHMLCLVAQPCLTLCDLMDCSLPGSSVYRILQIWILEWVAIPFSRDSSWPRDWSWVSCTVGRHFTTWATREVLANIKNQAVSSRAFNHCNALPQALQGAAEQFVFLFIPSQLFIPALNLWNLLSIWGGISHLNFCYSAFCSSS